MKKKYSDYIAIGKPGSRFSPVITTTIAVTALLVLVISPYSSGVSQTEPAHTALEQSRIDVNNGFAELVEAVKPAVVNISVASYVKQPKFGGSRQFQDQPPQLQEFFRRFFGDSFRIPENAPGNDNNQYHERRSTAVGSGFIIDPDGFVVTNHHVVEDADEIEVVLDDGTRVPATLRGSDRKTDLALLQIETDTTLPYVEFGDSDEARVGDWVIAIGNPFGLGGTTTSGIISARGRDLRMEPLVDFIQIDASINKGSSGGPLFNIQGQVIGINSAIYSPNGGSVGIGFAIPSSVADNIITQLQQDGVVQRGYLGVQIQAITEEIAESLGLQDESGALVAEVLKDTPAAAAGIEPGDVILEFNGKKIKTMRDLPKRVAETTSNQQVDITLWRDNDSQTVQAVIASTDSAPAVGADSPIDPELGLELAELNPDLIKQYGLTDVTEGVVITSIEPRSHAAQRGLRVGDIIKQVDKTPVSTPDDVVEAVMLAKEEGRDSVLFLAQTGRQSRFVVIPLKG